MEPSNNNPPQPNSNPEPMPQASPSPAPADPVTVQPEAAAPPQSADSAPAAAPTVQSPGIVTGDGGLGVPAASSAPFQPTTPPGITPASPNGRSKKLFLIGGGVVILLLAAAFYFGYYTNPSVVYSQSLHNTGKGYDKLVSYFDTASKTHYKSYVADGTYKLDSDSYKTDGKVSVKSDGGSNSETTFDIGLAATRLNFDIRTVKSSGNAPDIYFKADGLNGVGNLLGSADLNDKLNKLNNSWVVIDHTLLDNISQQATQTDTTKFTPPTQAQVVDELHAFGKVNQDYVFTTNGDKGVTKVTQKVGKETVDGHKTFHYKVKFVKANVKKYITAQRDALKASQLEAWIKKNKYDKSVDDQYNQLQKSADKINESKTYDIWVDTQHRLIYKVRLPEATNPAENYADIGLDYKGGDELPFFLTGKSNTDDDKSSGTLKATLNQKANTIKLDFNVASTVPDKMSVTGSMTFQPSNNSIKVAAPTGAQQISQVLDELGLGDLLDLSALSAGGQDQAKDTKRRTDVQSLQVQLEVYFTDKGNYPSLSQLNNAAWRHANLQGFDDGTLTDPDGSATTLAGSPAPKVYAYQPKTDSGGSCEAAATTCTDYTLTATLSDGTQYTKTALD